MGKVTDATLALWSEVLTQLPTARLRLQGYVFRYEASVAHMRERLTAANINPTQVDLVAGTGWISYMAAYSEVDIVLDTIPFPGGTTTAEALWMGVPTVTLSGNTLISRQGESMLRCVGLNDWVASNPEDYVRIALEKVADLTALGALRSELRSKALASPLFDGERFARNLETAFEGMALAKLGSRSPSASNHSVGPHQ
jgi:predicted O-linked N-acetylglucosamine transferase (SPINDLY family)